MNYKTLILVALAPEWMFLKQERSFSAHEKIRGLFVSKENPDIAVFQFGLGVERAKAGIEKILNEISVSRVIHFGVSGGLNEFLHSGDSVFVSHVVDQQTHEIIDLRDDHKNFSLETDAAATLLTVKEVLPDHIAKKTAGEKYSADLVDMETYPIAKICKEKQIPYLSFRAIFDHVDDDLTGMTDVHDDAGDLKNHKVAVNILKNPKLIFTLPGLKKRYDLCQKALSKNLEMILE